MRSSLNVDISVFYSMNEISDHLNITMSDLAKEILFYTINTFNSEKTVGLLTEYQNHNPDQWKCLDYNMNQYEADTFASARLKFRMSVSKILFIGFMLFGNIVVSLIKKRFGIKVKKEAHSYEGLLNLYGHLLPYFKKRLNLIQKE